jgi:hypothetical protein
MDNCPNFNKQLFEKTIDDLDKITNGDFMKTLNECPTSLENVSKNDFKKMHGGALTKKHFKYAVYLLYAILFSIGAYGSKEIVMTGLFMIATGKCYHLDQMFSFFPNPLCKYWVYFLELLVRLTKRDETAIGILFGMLVVGVSVPYQLEASANSLAERLHSTFNKNQIEYSRGRSRSRSRGRSASRRRITNSARSRSRSRGRGRLPKLRIKNNNSI